VHRAPARRQRRNHWGRAKQGVAVAPPSHFAYCARRTAQRWLRWPPIPTARSAAPAAATAAPAATIATTAPAAAIATVALAFGLAQTLRRARAAVEQSAQHAVKNVWCVRQLCKAKAWAVWQCCSALGFWWAKQAWDPHVQAHANRHKKKS